MFDRWRDQDLLALYRLLYASHSSYAGATAVFGRLLAEMHARKMILLSIPNA